MEFSTLNNGVQMPLLGFGVYQVEDPALCEQSVADAIETGYRLIDTASVYLNEATVGSAVRKSSVPREEFFITSKVWIQDMGYEATRLACERSLQRLGMDYMDLYLLHMPFGDVFGAWRAMEELYKEGRVRAIGVCNFHTARLTDLMEHHRITPVVNQIETHIFHQQRTMKDYADRNDIRIEAWGPFAEGKNNFFRNEVLMEIAAKYGRTVAQVALRWLMQRGIVVIPKSVHRERIEENFRSFGFELSEEDLARIAACDTGRPVIGNFDDPEFVHNLCNRKYAI